MEEFTTKFENLWDSFFPNPTPAQLYAANDLKHQVVNNSHEDLLNTDFTAAEEVLGQDFVNAILLCGLWMKNQRSVSTFTVTLFVIFLSIQSLNWHGH